MSLAAAWRWCLAAGLLAFACSKGFGLIPGLHACGPTGGMGPILAFEFARTPDAVAALFGAEPCRSTFAAAQRTGLWLDALGFIPGYTAFLGLAAWASGGRRRKLVIGFALAAGLADQVEGVLLFTVLRDLPGTQTLLDALGWAVGAKFLLLTLTTITVGVLLAETQRTVAMLFGGVLFFFGLRIVLNTDGPEAAMSSFTIAWVALLLAAALASWRASAFSPVPARQPPAPAQPSA